MSSRCMVGGCRFPSTHVTRAHKCGRCGRYGHGRNECNDPLWQTVLNAYMHEVVSDPCQVEYCVHRHLHTNEGHWCTTCRRYGGGRDCCPFVVRAVLSTGKIIRCPSCRMINDVDVNALVHTGGECVVCFQSEPMVLFNQCRHANVCRTCVDSL